MHSTPCDARVHHPSTPPSGTPAPPTSASSFTTSPIASSTSFTSFCTSVSLLHRFGRGSSRAGWHVGKKQCKPRQRRWLHTAQPVHMHASLHGTHVPTPRGADAAWHSAPLDGDEPLQLAGAGGEVGVDLRWAVRRECCYLCISTNNEELVVHAVDPPKQASTAAAAVRESKSKGSGRASHPSAPSPPRWPAACSCWRRRAPSLRGRTGRRCAVMAAPLMVGWVRQLARCRHGGPVEVSDGAPASYACTLGPHKSRAHPPAAPPAL